MTRTPDIAPLSHCSVTTGSSQANTVSGTLSLTPVSTAVPEPGSLVLLATGLAGLALVLRWRRRGNAMA